MAKEPPSEKKPDSKSSSEPSDRGDDILSDSSIEELDLESLLSEELSDDTSRTHGAKASPAGASKEGAVVDDGEIDLLADDVLEEAEPVTADDLLAMDETPEESAAGANALASDSATNGQKISSGELVGDLLGDEMNAIPDDSSEIDLLADEPEPTPTHASRMKSGRQEAMAENSGDADDLIEGDDLIEAEVTDDPDETVPLSSGELDVVEESAAPAAAAMMAAAAAAGDEPAGKKGKGKKSKDNETKKMARGAAKKAPAAKSPRKEKAESRPAGAVRVRGSIAFVCSECYEEFLLPSNYSQEMVSCPDCLHVGKRPDENFLRTVCLHKAGEKKSFLLALAAGAVLIALLLGVLWITSDAHLASGKGAKPDSNLVLGLAGGSGLLAALFVWLSIRFEGNRWEVYF